MTLGLVVGAERVGNSARAAVGDTRRAGVVLRGHRKGAVTQRLGDRISRRPAFERECRMHTAQTVRAGSSRKAGRVFPVASVVDGWVQGTWQVAGTARVRLGLSSLSTSRLVSWESGLLGPSNPSHREGHERRECSQCSMAECASVGIPPNPSHALRCENKANPLTANSSKSFPTDAATGKWSRVIYSAAPAALGPTARQITSEIIQNRGH